MRYVTSRGFELPSTAEAMNSEVWFNLWSRRLWPYNDLDVGDEVWWYESPNGRLRWHTRVVEVDSFPYDSLDAALDRFDDAFRATTDRGRTYLRGARGSGTAWRTGWRRSHPSPSTY